MFRRLLIALAGATVLGGCVTYPESKPVTAPLRPAVLPEWRTGDRVVTADRDGGDVQTWTVSAVRGDKVSWVSDDGERYTGFRNIAMPEVEWSNEAWGDGTEEILEVRGDIFPLRVGKRMTIASRGSTSKATDGWSATRNCAVVSQENITVPAGTFDTYKVVCTTEYLTLTWYYAPEAQAVMVSERQQRGALPSYRVTQSVDR